MTEFLALYFLFLKATLTSFSGPTTLPVVRQDFVSSGHRITDRQLNTAVAIGRVTPGPKGNYLISVGHFAAGWPGAIAAWLALVTPALLILPIMHTLGRHTDSPAVKRVLDAVILAGGGLTFNATVPLARDGIVSLPAALIAAVAIVLMLRFKWDTLWIVLLAAAAGMLI